MLRFLMKNEDFKFLKKKTNTNNYLHYSLLFRHN